MSRTVTTSKNNLFRYDILVMATGSVADLPSYITRAEAANTNGVFVYRSIADLEGIIQYAERVKRATVVGGGLLGLEAAKAVYDIGVPDVSIMIRQDYPLNRQLDAPAGELVMQRIKGMGVNVLTRCSPKGISADDGTFTGFIEPHIESDMVIFATGIRPRDDLAAATGMKTAPSGGIIVDDSLLTNLPNVYAIGECANWRGNYYGLIAPGIEMASILAFNLTQTHGRGAHAPRKMNPPDLSTRLKLMGVDVASFGNYFADARKPTPGEVAIHQVRRDHLLADGPIKCLTYHDPIASVYKKYLFSEDGKHLIGGMMIGDVSDFTKLVAITKKKKALDVPPSQFILGAKANADEDGDDLDDDAVVCSCHNVTKGAISQCVKDGMTELPDIKCETKAGSGCGGCVPLVTAIFKSEMKKAGHKINKK